MIGQDAIGFHAIGEGITGSAAPVTYLPVSRILAGGYTNARPPEHVVLGVDLMWSVNPGGALKRSADFEDIYMIWDNDTNIGWEA